MFYEAGGRIAMGTDAGTPFNRHGDNAQELAFMMELGVRPLDAITFATHHGARLNRLENLGRLAEGAVADLLVVKGNPLEDISRVAERSNHCMVIKRGTAIPRPTAC